MDIAGIRGFDPYVTFNSDDSDLNDLNSKIPPEFLTFQISVECSKKPSIKESESGSLQLLGQNPGHQFVAPV